MNYSHDQKALITSLLETKIAPRTKSDSLRQTLLSVLDRLYADKLTESDLILLNSALELLLPDNPQDESKEEYRELVELFVMTRKLLAEAAEESTV